MYNKNNIVEAEHVKRKLVPDPERVPGILKGGEGEKFTTNFSYR